MNWYNEHDQNLQKKLNDIVVSFHELLNIIDECKEDSNSEFNTEDLMIDIYYFLNRWD